jgi:uncharacterized protein (TIGR02246 family)
MSQTKDAPPRYILPPPSPELRRLDPLVGEWTVEGYARESPAGPAGPVSSRETFEWLDGGYFLVHRYDTKFGDEPRQKGVMYWGYDTEGDRFLLHFFSNNGPYTPAGNVYEGRVHGSSLVCTGPARFTIALDEHGRIRVGDDAVFETDWELRDDEGEWRSWMRNTYRRGGAISNEGTNGGEIRTLVENWASAVRRRDYDGILRHHGHDLLMFDVPPPLQSKGLEAYKRTWELFFAASRDPVVFDIVDMSVVAGSDVAFAAAIVRCSESDPSGAQPDLTVRLSIGLRKIDGDWKIVHEHHSIPNRP